MRSTRVLSAFLGLVAPATAWAWPAEEAWLPFQQGGVPLYDVAGDHGGADGSVDLVGEEATGYPVAYWYADDDALYLRMRVDDDPWFANGSVLRAGAWAFLLETDGDTADYEWILGISGAAAPTLALWQNTDDGDGVSDPPEDFRYAWADTLSAGRVRIEQTTSSLDGEYDWFVDMAVPRVDLENQLGADILGTFQVVIATANDSTLAGLADDVAGPETVGAVPDALTDPVGIDQDGDGLSDPEEQEHGSDPTDADSDDDGLDDQTEVDLGTGPDDCDSDDDGLSDGLERGVTEAGEGTDTAAGCFTPDADPLTTTDPLVADTDTGSLLDGSEDVNGDGAVGDWETDPNDPTDDIDGDGDGVPDVVEELCDDELGDVVDRDGDGRPDADEGLEDSDGDGLPDFCDEDDDQDGLPSDEEGDEDTDGDGLPDWQDPDSDDDGVPDGDEPAGDGDCDGVDDVLDADESDGPCGDPDGDGVGNEDEADCGSAPDVADTDGDGISDGGEPCDADEDCDGLPDRLDATFEDGLCEGGEDDTGPVTPCDPDDAFLDCGHLTGGSCSVVNPATALVPALLAAAAVLRRRRRAALAALAVAPVLAPALVPAAHAQDGLDVQRFRPTPDGRAFVAVEDSVVPGAGVGGALMFNYADDPLVWRMDDGTQTPLIGSLGTLDVVAFWSGADRVRIAADLPLHMTGTTGFTDGGFRLGDVRLDAKVSLLDRRRSPLGLAVAADLALPTGDDAAWLGAAGPDLGGRAIVAVGRRSVLSANLGARVGKAVELYPDLAWGPRMTWGVGGSVPLGEGVRAIAEVDGEVALGNEPGVPGAIPAEWRVGAHFLPRRELVVTTAFGTGLSTGVGAPDYRLIAGVAWVPPAEKRGGPPVGADRDGDGIGDAVDLCPDQPEDKNGRNDQDGCPDAGLTPVRLEVKDPRGARVAGAVLELVAGPEAGKYVLGSGEMTRSLRPGTYRVRVVADGYMPEADELRVPDADHHEHSFTVKPELVGGEVVVNARNAAGEPLSALVSVIGSPGRKFTTGPDGLGTERLPPGEVELSVWAEGYRPKRVRTTVRKDEPARVDVVLEETRVTVTPERVEIRDKVFFEFDSASIKAESLNILDDVAATLVNHPEIRFVEVQGHTDDQGTDAYNLELSQRRAESVRAYLIGQGVAAERLVAKGYGESQPLAPDTTEEARERNRRVVFQIVAGAPPHDGRPPPPGERPPRPDDRPPRRR